jgi:hypothetical protein
VRTVDLRDERILVETNRFRITGLVSLPRDGYRSRLTDYLNASERTFMALTDVEITPIDGGDAPERCEFLALALSQIVFARPLAAPGDSNG